MQEECCDWDEGYDDQLYRDSAEFDIEGEIETTIFVSKTPLEKDQTLDLAIVYTPYRSKKNIIRKIIQKIEIQGFNKWTVVCRLNVEGY